MGRFSTTLLSLLASRANRTGALVCVYVYVYVVGTSMDTKDHVVNDDRQGEVVEQICKVVPDLGASVFLHALCVKSICLMCLASAMQEKKRREGIVSCRVIFFSFLPEGGDSKDQFKEKKRRGRVYLSNGS